jgi:hypothetical protein
VVIDDTGIYRISRLIDVGAGSDVAVKRREGTSVNGILIIEKHVSFGENTQRLLFEFVPLHETRISMLI